MCMLNGIEWENEFLFVTVFFFSFLCSYPIFRFLLASFSLVEKETMLGENVSNINLDLNLMMTTCMRAGRNLIEIENLF